MSCSLFELAIVIIVEKPTLIQKLDLIGVLFIIGSLQLIFEPCGHRQVNLLGVLHQFLLYPFILKYEFLRFSATQAIIGEFKNDIAW